MQVDWGIAVEGGKEKGRKEKGSFRGGGQIYRERTGGDQSDNFIAQLGGQEQLFRRIRIGSRDMACTIQVGTFHYPKVTSPLLGAGAATLSCLVAVSSSESGRSWRPPPPPPPLARFPLPQPSCREASKHGL